MKSERYMKLYLTKKEANVLLVCIGKQSDADRIKWGINVEGLNFMHELYDDLIWSEVNEE
jgi:uncharacterized protein (DUF952 family)